jgi:hypothetical protein
MVLISMLVNVVTLTEATFLTDPLHPGMTVIVVLGYWHYPSTTALLAIILIAYQHVAAIKGGVNKFL